MAWIFRFCLNCIFLLFCCHCLCYSLICVYGNSTTQNHLLEGVLLFPTLSVTLGGVGLCWRKEGVGLFCTKLVL